MKKIKIFLNKILGRNKVLLHTEDLTDFFQVRPENYESEFFKNNPNGRIVKVALKGKLFFIRFMLQK